MTIVNIHGILAQEYGKSFKFNISNPKDILEAIDCNRSGFIQRLIKLQKEGFCYDLIINKKRITHGPDMDHMKNPETIDLVPAISGSGGFIGGIISLISGGGLVATIAKALIFAAISYALAPKPENEALEIEADGSKSSLIFSNTINVASQGSAVPLGYGRLKVGSQVIQATIKSFPQNQQPQKVMERSSDRAVTSDGWVIFGEDDSQFIGNRVS
jgi:predicted phage tail protein